MAEFTKEQILKAKRFKAYRDILNVLLEAGKSYSIADVEILLADFLNGKV